MANPGPSLRGAFGILGALGRARLTCLGHKLGSLRPGSRESKLLHAMVLLALGQDTEARVSLESLEVDTVAQLVARQWADVEEGIEGPEEPPDLSWTVARLYHLLAEENLCPASARDMAYQVALRDLASRGDHQLGQLQDEAWDRCCSDMRGDPCGLQPLCSHQGSLPPPSAPPTVTRSQPCPIDTPDWSGGHTLRSTGSTASLASHLEISQSPTLPFLSSHHGTPGPSKLCDTPPDTREPQRVPEGCQEPEERSWPPSVETSISLGPPHEIRVPEVASPILPDSLAAPATCVHCPIECTDSPTRSPSPLPSTTGRAGKQWPPQVPAGHDPLQNATSSSPPAQPPPLRAAPSSPSSCPAPPASAAPVVGHLEASDQKFYNFVVLHARADEQVALRIREKLETLGVPDGATFCEEFQVPGRGELRCLQDAIDHSGFTILLLTASFDCHLSLHQVNHALMNSLTQSGRQDCVIPLLPLECSQAQLSPDTTRLLHSIVWLDEHSPLFARKVANTFKTQKLWAQRARWKKEQEARTLKEQSIQLEGERQKVAAISAAYSAYAHSYRALQAEMNRLGVAFGKDLSLGAPTPFPSWPGCPQPIPSHPQGGTPVSPCPLQPPVSPPLPQSFPSASSPAPHTPGPQPLIIHHAQMVQLGVNNHMWGHTGAQSPDGRTECSEEACVDPLTDQEGPLPEAPE
ncbi:TIR domain-containing adapter molecule 1 [Apodemus sylvaticus]|uniref:TIR domain-containing adapter molecule 1 n=1 Tax=Apodemus sylvaticus TaxID=10129 RepID=UPI0022446AB8|nr:TIR domain-containing adapter molecule 1 [Apodemus sylvaticus]